MSALFGAGVVTGVVMGVRATLMIGRLRRRCCAEFWGLEGGGSLGLEAVVKRGPFPVGCAGVSSLGRNGTLCWPGWIATWLVMVDTVGTMGRRVLGCWTGAVSLGRDQTSW